MTHQNVLKILKWGHITPEELVEHHVQLIARGYRWPWTGYELRKMKDAGQFPRKDSQSSRKRVIDVGKSPLAVEVFD